MTNEMIVWGLIAAGVLFLAWGLWPKKSVVETLDEVKEAEKKPEPVVEIKPAPVPSLEPVVAPAPAPVVATQEKPKKKTAPVKKAPAKKAPAKKAPVKKVAKKGRK